ncbi:hypothetical protein ACEWY4_005219 [Coilia grayii]|uniref:Zonadhesin n=1 Tax=Coilia grayii TaxID=363190 RepID=A0ABD1KHX8_9TELE
MNHPSATSDSSHGFSISSEPMDYGAGKKPSNVIRALLKKQQTWRHLRQCQGMDGMNTSYDSLPQFRCKHKRLIMRFAAARHTDPFLLTDDLSPINIQHLPAHCKHRALYHEPWMLFKIFLNGCYLHHKVMKWMQLNSLMVQYFDRLLMQNITGVASCLSLTPPRPASTKAAAPVVMCKKHELLVKLPGRALKQVSVSDIYVDQERDIKQWRNNTFLYVKINIEKDQAFTLIYSGLSGKLKKLKVSCVQKHRSRLPRSIFDIYWGDSESPIVPFNSSDFSTDTNTIDPSSNSDTTDSFTDTDVSDSYSNTGTSADTDMSPASKNSFEEFGHFGEYWGFPDIPTGPYTPKPIVTKPTAVTTRTIPGSTTPATTTIASPPATTTSEVTTTTQIITAIPTTTLAETTPVPTTTLAETTTSIPTATLAETTTLVPTTILAETTTSIPTTTLADTTTFVGTTASSLTTASRPATTPTGMAEVVTKAMPRLWLVCEESHKRKSLKITFSGILGLKTSSLHEDSVLTAHRYMFLDRE